MSHIASVNFESADGISGVVESGDGALAGVRARTRSIELGDGAGLRAQETVVYTVRVDVRSRDRPTRIDIKGLGTLTGPTACARDIEQRECAVRSPHIAVEHEAGIKVERRNGPHRVDT